MPLKRQGVGEARHEDLLLALRDRRDRDSDAEVSQHGGCRRELPLPAVDQDQVGELAALLLEARVAPADHLGDGREVVDTLDRPYPEPPVVPFVGLSPEEPDHRAHHRRPGEMRDIEALDRDREVREVQPAFEFVQSDPVAEERDLDVLFNQVEQVLLLAPLRHDHPDLAAPEVREVAGDGVVDRNGQDHLLRRFVVGVVAGEELLQEPLRLVEGVLALPRERSPVDVEEHQKDGSFAHDIVDDILVVGLLPVDVLAFAQPFECRDLVAEFHRPLVLLPPG